MRQLAPGVLLFSILGMSAMAQDSVKDWKDVPLKDLGYEPVKPMKEKSGFVIGGKNPTELIRKLTHINGKSIKALEDFMRPGASSTKGFLGKDESLLEILAEDNDYVTGKLGMTHQDLARPLLILAAIVERDKKEITYHGKRFSLKLNLFRGVQVSPFNDDTSTNKEVELTNLDNKQSLRYSVLVPIMIERYGFYEGKGTPYRVPPQKIVDVLDFLKAK